MGGKGKDNNETSTALEMLLQIARLEEAIRTLKARNDILLDEIAELVERIKSHRLGEMILATMLAASSVLTYA
jgi:hypothetical protein